MSPTRAASGLSFAKSLVRAPVGSRTAICSAWRFLMGSLKMLADVGGGGRVFIFFLTVLLLVYNSISMVGVLRRHTVRHYGLVWQGRRI